MSRDGKRKLFTSGGQTGASRQCAIDGLTVMHGPVSLRLVERELRPFVRGVASLIDGARGFAQAGVVMHHIHIPAIRDPA